MIEQTLTFKSELTIEDRLFYNNPDGDSIYDIYEIEVAALRVHLTSKGVNDIIYECITPFDENQVTISGYTDRQVYKDLQEVADYKNTYHHSNIKLIDGGTLIVCVDEGIKNKIKGEWKLLIPCRLSKIERLNYKRQLH